jgi:hypothetical protein
MWWGAAGGREGGGDVAGQGEGGAHWAGWVHCWQGGVRLGEAGDGATAGMPTRLPQLLIMHASYTQSQCVS